MSKSARKPLQSNTGHRDFGKFFKEHVRETKANCLDCFSNENRLSIQDGHFTADGVRARKTPRVILDRHKAPFQHNGIVHWIPAPEAEASYTGRWVRSLRTPCWLHTLVTQRWLRQYARALQVTCPRHTAAVQQATATFIQDKLPQGSLLHPCSTTLMID